LACYEKLVTMAGAGDSQRVELAEAKKALAGQLSR
jgi:hypothetical protein